MTDLIICDIDGTIADITHRLHHIQKKPADWKQYNAQCVFDRPILDVIDVVKTVSYGMQKPVVFITGRAECCRKDTEEWLEQQGFRNPQVFMRANGDYQADIIVKKAIATQAGLVERAFCVFEDRARVVDMWRDLGLRCFSVVSGDY